MIDTQQNSWDIVANAISFSLSPNLDALTNLITPKAKVLDYGCGYGRITQELYERGYINLTGVDTSIEMIKRGLTLFPTLDLRHILTYEIPAELGKYDVILLCAVLTCIPIKEHRTKIIRSVHDALNRGGILYCIDFQQSSTKNYSSSGTFSSKLGIEMKHFLPQEISDELAIFSKTSQTITEATTISGEKTSAIHHFAKKL
ncbi:MAG: class I SAM-dependent methyltransferase [Methylococcales bacterium]|jgi:SAM-dependent methyltransferase